MKKMTYKEKFIQMNKEAKWVWLGVAIIFTYWWLTGMISEWAPNFTLFHLPGWFVLSDFGTYILTVIYAIFLVKKIFIDFEFDEEEPDAPPKYDEAKYLGHRS